MSTGQNQIVEIKWADGFKREFTFARPEDAQHFARALLGKAEVTTRVNGAWEWFPGTSIHLNADQARQLRDWMIRNVRNYVADTPNRKPNV